MKKYTQNDVERLCCKIIELVKKEADEPVTPEKCLFTDCGLDSLQFVTVLVEFETQFGIEFEDVFDELYDMTISELAEYIYKRLQ